MDLQGAWGSRWCFCHPFYRSVTASAQGRTCVCVCVILQSCLNVLEAGEMQKGSELGAAQEHVSQPELQEVAKPTQGQSTNTCSATATHCVS